MKLSPSAVLIGLLATTCHAGSADSAEANKASSKPLKTRNVLLVTTDGLRWQEVFRGAERPLISKKEGGVSDVPALEKEFWRDDAKARREALMPFLWGEVVPKGQLFGNFDAGSDARVTNGKNFSYPGYNEILSGKADPRIDSNDNVLNPNVTILEWLEKQPGFQGRVAGIGSWDVFTAIMAARRGKFYANSGFEPFEVPEMNGRVKLLNRLMEESPRIWAGERYDSITHHMSLEYIKQKKPRFLFIGHGDTDEFAHEGRYDHYLRAARRVDDYLKELWETVQAMPEYRDTTTLIVSTDHGRGDAAGGEWKSHGVKIKGSERIWIGVLGPDTPGLGVRGETPAVTQSQISATIAALLGLDPHAFRADAAPPIGPVVGRE